MGMYDNYCYPNGDVQQLKCWDRTMRDYRNGDTVPDVHGESTYIIQTPEGDYIYVENNVIKNERVVVSMFDKWGNRITMNSFDNVLKVDRPYED